MIDIIKEYGQAFLWTDGYQFTGIAVTLFLLVITLVFGFILSIPLAVGRLSKNRFIALPIWLFSYVFRGTPFFVQLLVIYTGIYTLGFVRESDFLDWFFSSGYRCALLALVLNTTAYTIEIFAGAIRSLPHGEIEAAKAYGFSGYKLYRCIVLPAALRQALPAYSNEVILVLHATSLVFTVTVPDILKVARDANSATYQSFAAFGTAALIYLALSFILVALFNRAEKRWLAHLRPMETSTKTNPDRLASI
ncbi:ABC transporter permease [Saccharospirillum alexandrii]|uniref:ABC transporter permease n=1 Tax=Saccharospirillum alexandrii TaxID=2448477 RepID=UPI000FD7060E|nr:ABC transporter permease [Saccharospirillum alexandrii]